MALTVTSRRMSPPVPAGLFPAAALLILAPALPGLAAAGTGTGIGTGASALRAEAEAAVGSPVAIDPRLRVPDCPGGFRFAPAGEARTVRIACPQTGWQAVAPIAARAGAHAPSPAATGAATGAATPAIRRGDVVTVGFEAPGFRVTVEAVAEASAAPGERVILRNRITGQRFPATVGADGTLAMLRR